MSILGVLSLMGILQLNLTLLIFIQFNCAKRKSRKNEQQKNVKESKKCAVPEPTVGTDVTRDCTRDCTKDTRDCPPTEDQQKSVCLFIIFCAYRIRISFGGYAVVSGTGLCGTFKSGPEHGIRNSGKISPVRNTESGTNPELSKTIKFVIKLGQLSIFSSF